MDISEKRQKRRAFLLTARLTALLLLTDALSFGLQYLFSYLHPLVFPLIVKAYASLTGVSGAVAYSLLYPLLQSPLFSYVFSVLITVFCFFLPFRAFAPSFADSGTDEPLISLDGHLSAGKLLAAVFACFSLASLAGQVASILCDDLSFFMLPFDGELLLGIPDESGLYPSFADTFGYFLSVCVLPPLAEEFVFRGVIFGSLRRFGLSYAAFASALLFGLAHGSFASFVYAGVLGLGLAVLYEKTGTLWACVGVHFLNNTLLFVEYDLLPSYLSEQAYAFVKAFIGVAAVVLALLCLALIIRSDRREAAAVRDGGDGCDDEAVVPFSAILSPLFLLYVLWFLYIAFFRQYLFTMIP